MKWKRTEASYNAKDHIVGSKAVEQVPRYQGELFVHRKIHLTLNTPEAIESSFWGRVSVRHNTMIHIHAMR